MDELRNKQMIIVILLIVEIKESESNLKEIVLKISSSIVWQASQYQNDENAKEYKSNISIYHNNPLLIMPSAW